MTAQTWRDLLSTRFDSPDQAAITRLVSQRLGAVVAAAAFAARLSPNTVTGLGLALTLLGCLPFVLGEHAGAWLAAAALWQLAFAFDCADGQLARATQRTSRYGAWLDVSCDHVRQSALAVSVFTVAAPVVGLLAAALAAFLFSAGQSAYLHTASLMNVLKPPSFSAAASVSGLRSLLRFLLDTPLLLIMLCVLRPWPLLLAAFVAGYGALLLVRAAAIGRSRLRA
jgi:phosphatidylglycerophosphate synthase